MKDLVVTLKEGATEAPLANSVDGPAVGVGAGAGVNHRYPSSAPSTPVGDSPRVCSFTDNEGEGGKFVTTYCQAP